MSLYLTGLCGNFNDKVSDDFKVISGLVEGTAAAFGNTWKTSASCPDITGRLYHPCSQGINKGTARLSCSLFIIIPYESILYERNYTIPYFRVNQAIFIFILDVCVSQRVMPSTGAPK